MILINNPWNALRMTLHWISNRMTYYYFTTTKDLLYVVLRSSVSLLVLMLSLWSDWAWGAWGEVDTAVEPQFKLEPNGHLHPTTPFFFPPTTNIWVPSCGQQSSISQGIWWSTLRFHLPQSSQLQGWISTQILDICMCIHYCLLKCDTIERRFF